MRVLLIADVGTNAEGFYHIGDEAMMYQMVQRYRQEQPETKLGLLSRSISHQTLPVKEFLHLPFPTADIWLRSPVYCLKLMVFCVVKRLTKHDFFKPQERKFLATLDHYQVFHFTGGGNIYSHHAPWLYYVFFLIWYGWWTKKSIWLTSQTIGPFNWFDGWLAKLFLALATSISIREASPAISGISAEKVLSCLDAAYDLPTKNRVLPQKRQKIFRIGLSLHEWKSYGPQIQQVIVAALKLVAQKIPLELVILPHVLVKDSNKWDLGFMSKIITQLPKEIRVITINYKKIMQQPEPSVYLKTVTADLDLMIATRYHALVFAVFSQFPVVSFKLDDYYTQKNSELLRMIYQKNWQRFLLPLKTSALVNAIEHMYQNTKKESKLLLQRKHQLTVPPVVLATVNQPKPVQ